MSDPIYLFHLIHFDRFSLNVVYNVKQKIYFEIYMLTHYFFINRRSKKNSPHNICRWWRLFIWRNEFEIGNNINKFCVSVCKNVTNREHKLRDGLSIKVSVENERALADWKIAEMYMIGFNPSSLQYHRETARWKGADKIKEHVFVIHNRQVQLNVRTVENTKFLLVSL